MSKTAKGKRPVYFDNAEIDKLLAIIMALTGEVSILQERLDTIERLLTAKGVLKISDIEAYEPDEEVAKEREQRRADYIARVLRILS
ncbi:MAG: hypothetical protein PUP93_07930 [Rhizonema sp. NSF051]|nr:hypothetical protein [Rhizonema sp. NSF051]